MRRLLLVLVAALALAGVAAGSNYNGWESQGAIMCNSAHNGWAIYQPDPDGGDTRRFVCGFAYDPGPGVYAPGWGFINSCPTGAPQYGYCWRWQD